MDITLVVLRALHFAATMAMSGVLLFRRVVFDPAEARRRDSRLHSLDRQMRRIFWIGLAVAFASGGAWFLVVSATIDDRTWIEAWADGTAWSVLTQTHFGQAWSARAVAGAILAVLVALAPRRGSIQPLLAVVFVASLAYGGHGASSPGLKGDAHLAADMLHLIAASAWLGGLVPFGLYLRSIGCDRSPDSYAEARKVARRFSILGIVSVLTIVATGIINTLSLVGSTRLLVSTDYGRLLILKLIMFFAMLTIAAFNRYRLVPNLSATAIKTLQRNSLVEAVIGLAVVAVVAFLGTLPPPLAFGTN